MVAKRATERDWLNLNAVATAIRAIQRDIVAANQDAIPSDFQFLETVLGTCKRSDVKLTRDNIRRLVDLGLVEQKPSDGHGASIKVKQ